MPRIDGKGNIIPDGAPVQPPPLPGGATMWLAVVILGVVALSLTVPTEVAFKEHIEQLTEVGIAQAADALKHGVDGSPIGAIGAMFGLKNLGALGGALVKMAAGILPAMYLRSNYGIVCVYTMGGQRYDEMAAEMRRKNAMPVEMQANQAYSLSSKYVGIAGRFFAIGEKVPALSHGGRSKGKKPLFKYKGDIRDFAKMFEDSQGEGASQDSDVTSEDSEPMVGGDRDEHGCIGSAGFVWCESRQKCYRSWEEECPSSRKEDDNDAASDDVDEEAEDIDGLAEAFEEL